MRGGLSAEVVVVVVVVERVGVRSIFAPLLLLVLAAMVVRVVGLLLRLMLLLLVVVVARVEVGLLLPPRLLLLVAACVPRCRLWAVIDEVVSGLADVANGGARRSFWMLVWVGLWFLWLGLRWWLTLFLLLLLFVGVGALAAVPRNIPGAVIDVVGRTAAKAAHVGARVRAPRFGFWLD